MEFKMGAFLNEGHNRFFEFRESDKLEYVSDYVVIAEDMTAAFEEFFAISNKQRPDADGIEWPFNVRSFSVGDVVIVRDNGVWVCDSMGWKPTDTQTVINGMCFGRRKL